MQEKDCNQWNKEHNIGTEVLIKTKLERAFIVGRTASQAYCHNGNALIRLDGYENPIQLHAILPQIFRNS